MALSKKNSQCQQQRHNYCHYKHSTAAAVFSSLLLRRVNVQTIFYDWVWKCMWCWHSSLNRLLSKQPYPSRCLTVRPISPTSITPAWNISQMVKGANIVNKEISKSITSHTHNSKSSVFPRDFAPVLKNSWVLSTF